MANGKKLHTTISSRTTIKQVAAMPLTAVSAHIASVTIPMAAHRHSRLLGRRAKIC